MFSFPMSLGAVTVGVVSLYALTLQTPWTDMLLRTAVGLVATAARPAVELAVQAAGAERGPGRQQTELRREVHQAAGMVMVQLGSTIDDAMSRLRARAFADGQPIDVIARAVVAGDLDFTAADD